MANTQEQQKIINYVETHDGLVLVDSIAGSGKTYILKEIAKAVKPKRAIYLAYSKAIATEAQKEFPKGTVECKTTHSIAYANTVKPLKLSIGFFNYKSIREPLPYEHKQDIVDTLKEFCLSKYEDFESYAENAGITDATAKITKKYVQKMADGEIDCTHDFYLKLFHIMLVNKDVEFEPFDLLMLDESGDLNEVTLEIFKLLPAKKKIAVGDKHQNIFTFNHTVNAFKLLEGEGKEFKLSQSFRVHKDIASRVERFCKKYLDPSMSFKGVEYADMTIGTRGIITRTNAALVDKMIELNKDKVPYTLIRKASDIFRVPLMVCGLKYQGQIHNKEYKHVQNDVDDWYESPELQKQYKTLYSYLLDIYAHDVTLVGAIKLVISKGIKVIIDTYETASSHEKTDSPLILATAHSCKGLEFDEAIITEDLNNTLDDIISNPDIDYTTLSSEALEDLNLYYVACTRGKKVLTNAKHL